MKVSRFINDIKDLMEIEHDLTVDSDLRKIPEFDSLFAISLVAYADENFNKVLNAKQLTKMTTIDNLMESIGREHFEEG